MQKEKRFNQSPEHRWRQNGRFDRHSKKLLEFEGNFLPMHPHYSENFYDDDDRDRGWHKAKKLYRYLSRWFKKQVGRNVDDVFHDFKEMGHWGGSLTMYSFWERYFIKPTDTAIAYYTRCKHNRHYTSDENNCLIGVNDLEVSPYSDEELEYVEHNRKTLEHIPEYGEVLVGGCLKKKYPQNKFFLGDFYVWDEDCNAFKIHRLYHFDKEPDDSYVRIYRPIGIDYLEWGQHHIKYVRCWRYNWITERYEDFWDNREFGLGCFNAYYKRKGPRV